jgi:GrpB-like predicted nucleotidyltransferase (UPF0157 family)
MIWFPARDVRRPDHDVAAVRLPALQNGSLQLAPKPVRIYAPSQVPLLRFTLLFKEQVVGSIGVIAEPRVERVADVGHSCGRLRDAAAGSDLLTRALALILRAGRELQLRDVVLVVPERAGLLKSQLESMGAVHRSSFERLGRRFARLFFYPIDVVDYDPQWPNLARREIERLQRLLGRDLLGRVEHFGSTAVKGLRSKPVLDLLGEIPSFEELQEQGRNLLEQEGYVFLWRSDCVPGHAMFVSGYERTDDQKVHLHLAPRGHPLWRRLLFSQFLQRNPQEAARYQRLKEGLASRFRYDREAYTEGKTEYVEAVTARARQQEEGG